jgi:hypothetical protein
LLSYLAAVFEYEVSKSLVYLYSDTRDI